MAEHVTVDTGRMRDTGARLGAISSTLKQAKNDLGGDVAAVAQHDLIKAMQGFVDNWRIHREKLIDSVDGHQKAIVTAAESYDKLDHDQASCLAQAGGQQ